MTTFDKLRNVGCITQKNKQTGIQNSIHVDPKIINTNDFFWMDKELVAYCSKHWSSPYP